MCAQFSPDDDLDQTVTAFDLSEVAKALIGTIVAHEKLTVSAAINGATATELRAAGIHNPNAVRSAMENAIDAYRATCRNAFERTSGTYADAMHLKDAQDACIARNNQGALRTAMHRVDATEAAERSLISSAHAAGADLARLDADHTYGKSAAPAPAHGTYERSFHSPAAA